MHNFLSTAIQHTKYMFMILQTGTWNFIYSRDQPGANPTPALKMSASPFINRSALPTSPSLPPPLLLLAIHLCCHRKNWQYHLAHRNITSMMPVKSPGKGCFLCAPSPAWICYAPSNLRTAGMQQQHYSF